MRNHKIASKFSAAQIQDGIGCTVRKHRQTVGLIILFFPGSIEPALRPNMLPVRPTKFLFPQTFSWKERYRQQISGRPRIGNFSTRSANAYTSWCEITHFEVVRQCLHTCHVITVLRMCLLYTYRTVISILLMHCCDEYHFGEKMILCWVAIFNTGLNNGVWKSKSQGQACTPKANSA